VHRHRQRGMPVAIPALAWLGWQGLVHGHHLAPRWNGRPWKRCVWSEPCGAHWWLRLSRHCWRMSRMMTPHSHTPTGDDEAFLDATVGIEPALIEAEPRQAPADRCVVDDDHTADWALLGQLEARKRQRAAFGRGDRATAGLAGARRPPGRALRGVSHHPPAVVRRPTRGRGQGQRPPQGLSAAAWHADRASGADRVDGPRSWRGPRRRWRSSTRRRARSGWSPCPGCG
jgi:hypothetical protein